MKKRHLYTLLLFVGLGNALSAQHAFSLTYDFGSFGSEDLQEFIEKDSWLGWQFEYQYFLAPKVSIGAQTGVQAFYEKRPRSTYIDGTTSINAVTWRYFTYVPTLFTSKFYFTESGLRPYIGGGIGIAFADQEIQIGDYVNAERRINFAMMGQGGLRFDFSSHWAGLLDVKYNYALYSPDDFDTSNIGYLSVGLGVLFQL